MSDDKGLVPTKTLVKHGTTGVGGVVGGAVLLLLGGLGPVGAAIIGGVLTLVGAGVGASSKEDRIAGAVVAGAGVLTILSGVTGIGSALLTVGGLGLLGFGVYSLFRFIRGLRSRR